MAYARTTITQLRSLIKERLGGDGVFWNEQEATLALNEALAVWQLLTGEFTNTYSQTIPRNGQNITLDSTASDPLNIIRIRRPSGAALYPMSLYEMDQGFYGRISAASGTPEYWAPLGINTFVVHPKASTTETVSVQYYIADPRLAADGTTYLDLGDEEIQVIVEYAQWFLAFKEGLKEALENVSPLKDIFLTAARLRNSRLRNTAPYRDYMGNARDEQEPDRDEKEQKGLRA